MNEQNIAAPAVSGTLVVAESADLQPTSPRALRRNDRGMISAEWAVGIIAAIAIAGVLITVVTNGAVQDALLKFILQVINSFSGFLIGK